MSNVSKIAFRPAMELSYPPKEQQHSIFITMKSQDFTPSLAQAIKIKQFSQDGQLINDVIFSILSEEKPNQKEPFKIPRKCISRYFPPGTASAEN